MPSERPTRVMVVDDHQMFIDGIKALLSDVAEFDCVGAANNGRACIAQLPTLSPDIILMDISMPEMDGIEACSIVQNRFPGIKVIMLTMFDSPDVIKRSLKAGASGYILKNTGRGELLQAIGCVISGEKYFGKDITHVVMQSLAGKDDSSAKGRIKITKREREVLQLIVQEYTAAEIADQLCISQHTVITHRKNLISKLGVRNIAGLVKGAILNNLLEE